MKKYKLVTTCAWSGAEVEHEIEGEYKNEEEALEAFGGEDEAWQQAIEDHEPQFHIEEEEVDDEDE